VLEVYYCCVQCFIVLWRRWKVWKVDLRCVKWFVVLWWCCCGLVVSVVVLLWFCGGVVVALCWC